MSHYAEILVVIETNEDWADVNVNCYVQLMEGNLEYGGIKATTEGDSLCNLIGTVVEKEIKERIHTQWLRESKGKTEGDGQ